MHICRRSTNIYLSALLIFVIGNVVLSSLHVDRAVAQQEAENEPPLDSTESLIIFINLERIRTQVNLTQNSLGNSDLETAFQHAYIPHSVTFPVLKPILSDIDPTTSKRLEALLTDLPIKVRTGESSNEAYSSIQSDIDEVNKLMKTIYDTTIGQSSLKDKDKGFLLQASAALLQDGVKSYQLSNATSSGGSISTVDYENALGFTSTSVASFEMVADSVNDRRRLQVKLPEYICSNGHVTPRSKIDK